MQTMQSPISGFFPWNAPLMIVLLLEKMKVIQPEQLDYSIKRLHTRLSLSPSTDSSGKVLSHSDASEKPSDDVSNLAKPDRSF